MLTNLHVKMIELDRQKDQVKKFYEEYSSTLEALIKEHGVNHAFQDNQGVVYQLVAIDGRWVNFDKYGLERTKRDGESRGSLSIKKAKELGFNVKE